METFTYCFCFCSWMLSRMTMARTCRWWKRLPTVFVFVAECWAGWQWLVRAGDGNIYLLFLFCSWMLSRMTMARTCRWWKRLPTVFVLQLNVEPDDNGSYVQVMETFTYCFCFVAECWAGWQWLVRAGDGNVYLVFLFCSWMLSRMTMAHTCRWWKRLPIVFVL